MHLTVAIATWNRAPLLAQTIASLKELQVPAEVTWDVMVCDNNSTDDTKAIVEEAAKQDHASWPAGFGGLTYLFEPAQGKSHALNHLLAASSADWMLFIDDDVRVDKAWMAGIVSAMARYPKAAILGGAVEADLPRKLSRREAFLMEHFPFVYAMKPVASDTPMGDTLTPGGANLAVKRSLAAEIGFDTNRGMFPGQRIAGEDATLSLAILKAGHEGWMVTGATVLHHTPSNGLGARRLFQWQIGIGRTWAVQRGKPEPGRFGVAWWAWREMLRRAWRWWIRWRPWPTKAYYTAMVEAAQYWGYLRAK